VGRFCDLLISAIRKKFAMTDEIKLIEKAFVETMSDRYQRASEELLYAYQRNKEASRHHEAGAFKAALHHAKLAKHHVFNAHEHLKEALHTAEKMKALEPGLRAPGYPLHGSAIQ